MSIEYSAAIRSVRDNAFLHRALHALQQQSVLPREILIVIPYDAVPWETGCSLVQFIQAAQGMVAQHADGILASQSAHLILMDDDIVLDRSACEVLLCALRTNNAYIVVPYWREGWLRCKLARLFYTFWGMALPLYVGGIKYTAGEDFYYPLSEPGANESWTTLAGDGKVIALDRTLAIQQACLGVFFLAGIISFKHRTFQPLCGAWDAVYVCYWRDVLSAIGVRARRGRKARPYHGYDHWTACRLRHCRAYTTSIGTDTN